MKEINKIIIYRDLIITGFVTFVVDENGIINIFQDWIDWKKLE